METPLTFFEGGVFSWRFLALLSLTACVAFEAIQYLIPLDGATPLLYLFYPASLIVFGLLVHECRYVEYPEVRFLFFFMLWMCATIVLNRSRAHIVDSYEWFASVCVTSFLFFSFPYAFQKEGATRVLTILAATTLAAVTLLSTVGLISVFAENVAERMPTLFSGFGFYAGRLTLDSNPNRSAPYCAAAVVLAVYLLVRLKKTLPRVLVSIGGVICFMTLALTDSRTAIIAASLAVGFEVFILGNVWLPRITWMKKVRASLRVVVCVVMMLAATAAFYMGTELVKTAYSAYSANYSVKTNVPTAEVVAEEAQPQETDHAPELVSRDVTNIESVNIRLDIWTGVLKGLAQNPRILAFGTGPVMASKVMSPYFPEGSPTGIFHNSLLGILVSFGIVGLLLALAFLVIVAVAAVRFAFGGLTNAETLAARLLPAMLLYTVLESVMEDFLFASWSLNITWIWFMFSAGFVLRYLRSDAPRKAAKEA